MKQLFDMVGFLSPPPSQLLLPGDRNSPQILESENMDPKTKLVTTQTTKLVTTRPKIWDNEKHAMFNNLQQN